MKYKYYYRNPRGFQNEYTVYQVEATDSLAISYLEELEAQQISYAHAEELITWRGDTITEDMSTYFDADETNMLAVQNKLHND